MSEKFSADSVARYQSKRIPTLIGIILSLALAFLLFSKSAPLFHWIEFVEDKTYDFRIRRIHQPLSDHSDVLIVGLDNESLAAEGRLPWSREKMALLVDRLKSLGAKVIAFDFLFSSPQENIALKVFQGMEGRLENEEAVKRFDFDAVFSKSLSGSNAVLGMVLTQDEENAGILPAPILTLASEQDQIYIPEKNSYIGNIPLLQQAAKNAGFINSTPDSDAIIRFSPLIYRMGQKVFGSLALTGVIEYLNIQKIDLIAKRYAEMEFLEAIELDGRVIPVDPMGRILVPYRGPSLTFPSVSATDVMRDRVSADQVRGKLIFVGATATGSGDLVSTPISQTFNGVEVHASIAQGMIDNYLPYKPGWEKGVSVALVLLFGIPLAFFLPRLDTLKMLLISGISVGCMLLLARWAWSADRVVLSMFFPIFGVAILFFFNIIYGHLMEARQKRAIQNVFGQYVSSEYIDSILEKGIGIEMRGESKDLSILFADIRGFTTFSEKMNAAELTAFLNDYFTEMTEAIFLNHGTIDKYIGDAVMAFWGAPLDDPQHPVHAVQSALDMEKRLIDFNLRLAREKKEPVEFGIGIASGTVYAGDMGSKFRRSYTAMGDDVNLSSRLEGLTKRYFVRCIVSEKTFLGAKERFLFRKLDTVQVKGKEKAVAIFEPLCSLDSGTNQIREEAALQERALEAYAQGKWDEARQIWNKLKGMGGNLKLFEMYLERMQTPSPPDPNWTGIQKFETK